MALTFGSGPFGPAGGRFDFALPERVRYWEPWPRRMRALLAGETVLDSRRGVLLHETDAFPTFYYPLDDMRGDLLAPDPSDPGRRPTWSVTVGQRVAARAVVGPPVVDGGTELLPGLVALEYDAMDRWFEEDDPIYAHPRDPYHRVDVRAASRHVLVSCDGEVVAESRRPKLLFETSNPVRYYVPFADVRPGVLELSTTVSECPYKGDGQHWHLRIGATTIDDVAWSLPHPLPEGLAAAEHVCFYPSKVEVTVDGVHVAD